MSHKAVQPGGLMPAQKATPEIQHLADQVKGELESRTKKTYAHYVAEKYCTQVVAGINYFIKVSVGKNDYVHLRVYQNLQQQVSLDSYQDGKTAADELVYF